MSVELVGVHLEGAEDVVPERIEPCAERVEPGAVEAVHVSGSRLVEVDEASIEEHSEVL